MNQILDLQRGTGRTTRMVEDAYFDAVRGQEVLLIFKTEDTAKEWQSKVREWPTPPTPMRFAGAIRDVEGLLRGRNVKKYVDHACNE